ncbi:hypothetical protein C3941_14745 [Kaistia algarum]|uniref:hypothetical protein n=1 Tax=Kaistia algarum TaxID=2083279 RepID=UPI000CE76F4E|nr:hypothetical protein [Kaistia algarum]MCX5514329.1 hypothetical protein [Kaistia algarum]PPE79082.1 hypothetical protein C3941_14745 [Kaistia algarum]
MGAARLRRGARVGAMLAALLVAGAAGAGERVPESEIERIFSGMTLDGTYANGSFFSETYNSDGTIRYHDPDGADSGEWSVKDGRFCTFYENAEGACFAVERDGANCFTFYAPSGTSSDAPLNPDWTSRGWDTTLPPTCPKAPEVQL